MRNGILRFNGTHGTVAGYHETITFAWIAIFERFLNEQARSRR
jgi:hypothetical protein